MRSHTHHWKLPAAVTLLTAALLVTLVTRASISTYYGTVNDQRAYGMVNGSRLERDRAIVRWNQTLARCAHDHALKMSHQQRAFHGGSCDGYTVTQLVGMGPSPAAIHEAFLSRGAPQHRATIFNTRLRWLGTGVAHRGDTYYVVLNFA